MPERIPSPSVRRILVFAAAAFLGWAGTLGPAVAQASDGGGDIQNTPSAHPCVAKPDDQAKGGTDEKDNRPQAALDACGGVLVPPKTGDHEMRMEPPDKGTMPVIPPGAIEPQQPG